MTRDNKPLISILICNYNYGKYIVETLDSAINQSYQNLEIIILDDGSQDDSVKIIRKYIKEHPSNSIYLHAKKKNQGVCYARNELIESSKGKYFLFIDSDDTIPPEYILDFYKTAVENDADVVYGDFRTTGGKNHETSNFPEYNPKELLLTNYINVSSLVKKDSIHSHRFDVSLNHQSHDDYDFWLGLSLEGLKFAKAPNAQLNYRRRTGTRNKKNELIGNEILNFIRVWKQIIDKYQQLYPHKINKEIVFEQLKYQINVMTHVESDIRNYSAIMQKELTAELNTKETNIKEQKQVIKEQKQTINNIVNSKRYRLATQLASPISLTKMVKDRIKHL